MKRIVLLSAIMLSVFPCTTLFAQEVNVAPGYGTLNDAVTTNGANKTYVLQAGKWYGLNATLQTPGPISIIGQTPAPGQMPAIVQTGDLSSGGPFHEMFDITGDFTMKNVFLVNADLSNVTGAWIFNQIASARVVLDSVVADPVGWQSLLAANSDQNEAYITNSIFLGHGLTTTGVDGWFIYSEGQRAENWDTLYVENNTFVDIGLFLYFADNFPQGINNFVWMNHNSMFFLKGELKYSYVTGSDYFTNNLLWQGDCGAFLHSYNDSRVGAGPTNTIASIIDADTLAGESLPSQRKAFWEYNFNSIDPRINAIEQLGEDSNLVAYCRPFVWPASMADSSREAWMFSDKAAFPNFYAGNNMEYLPNHGVYNSVYDVGGPFIDPKFSDSLIYAYTDTMVAWENDAARQGYGFPSNTYPSPANWPDYMYTRDNGGRGNPTIWPRFDGVYSNQQLLTASIEQLPLGDLNWFPDKKALWEQNKAKIMAHILSEDTSQFIGTAVREGNSQLPSVFALAQNYPNPFNPSTEIKVSLDHSGVMSLIIYNVLGQAVDVVAQGQKTGGVYTFNVNLDRFASGVYFYTLRQGPNVITKKMLLLK